jgi:hypothetical protein
MLIAASDLITLQFEVFEWKLCVFFLHEAQNRVPQTGWQAAGLKVFRFIRGWLWSNSETLDLPYNKSKLERKKYIKERENERWNWRDKGKGVRKWSKKEKEEKRKREGREVRKEKEE